MVGTPVGAVADLVNDGESGILVPVRNVDALFEALRRMLLEPGVRRKMGALGFDPGGQQVLDGEGR